MGIKRKTKSIQLLLNEFENNSSAISTVDLIEKLKTEINKTTIYRVLEKLEDDAVLHSFLGDNGVKWYAKCNGCTKSHHVDTHPHFQCISCGKIDCISVEVKIPEIFNREIITSKILIKGRCVICMTA